MKIKGAQTFLKCGTEAIEEDATIKDVINSALKPANGAVLGATVDQVAFIFIHIRDNHYAATLPNSPIVVSVIIQAGSGTKRRRAPVYKKATKHIMYSFNQRQIFYNFKNSQNGR